MSSLSLDTISKLFYYGNYNIRYYIFNLKSFVNYKQCRQTAPLKYSQKHGKCKDLNF